ncbi:putative ribonuclease H-like domain-containing protein [Tanacetum coccineum]|uniref:Ribonuclease H-like domain-containing protein n=1 Tax=Tanacetum coccineum TaxID=301880 RepID=A0ABQ5GQC9_9ASTR
MQEELLQFKLQQVWTLVDLPLSKRAIGTKWIYRNKKDERGIMIRNKARLVTQGYTKEGGIDYDEVFTPVAKIEAISSEDKYVDEILKKFSFSAVKTASTPMETSKPLLKDAEAEDVDIGNPNRSCLISWKQIDFIAIEEANDSTKQEYVAAASCAGQSRASTMVDDMGTDEGIKTYGYAQVTQDPAMYYGGYEAGYGVYPLAQ